MPAVKIREDQLLSQQIDERENVSPLDPVFAQAVQRILDLDDRGLRLNLEASDVPYNALIKIAEDLRAFGVEHKVADAFVEAIETQAVQLGADFTRKEKPTPLAIKVNVADRPPVLDQDKTHFMVAFDRNNKFGSSYSSVEAHLTNTGTKITTTNVPELETMFTGGGEKYLIIHFEKLEADGLNGLDETGVAMTNAVEAVGPSAPASDVKEIVRAIQTGKVTPEQTALIGAVASLNRGTEQIARSPNSVENAPQASKVERNTVTQALQTMTANRQLPLPAVMKAVISSMQRNEVVVNAAKPGITQRMSTAPKADNNNKISVVAAAPAALKPQAIKLEAAAPARPVVQTSKADNNNITPAAPATPVRSVVTNDQVVASVQATPAAVHVEPDIQVAQPVGPVAAAPAAPSYVPTAAPVVPVAAAPVVATQVPRPTVQAESYVAPQALSAVQPPQQAYIQATPAEIFSAPKQPIYQPTPVENYFEPAVAPKADAFIPPVIEFDAPQPIKPASYQQPEPVIVPQEAARVQPISIPVLTQPSIVVATTPVPVTPMMVTAVPKQFEPVMAQPSVATAPAVAKSPIVAPVSIMPMVTKPVVTLNSPAIPVASVVSPKAIAPAKPVVVTSAPIAAAPAIQKSTASVAVSQPVKSEAVKQAVKQQAVVQNTNAQQSNEQTPEGKKKATVTTVQQAEAVQIIKKQIEEVADKNETQTRRKIKDIEERQIERERELDAQKREAEVAKERRREMERVARYDASPMFDYKAWATVGNSNATSGSTTLKDTAVKTETVSFGGGNGSGGFGAIKTATSVKSAFSGACSGCGGGACGACGKMSATYDFVPK